MTTPSNPSGIPSLPVVALLAVILFLGLALAPRAFEFRAWPEFVRPAAVEEVVDRPLPEVPRIEVAGVQAADTRRGARGSRHAVVDARGRGGDAERAAEREGRRAERARRRASSRRGGSRGGSGQTQAQTPEFVVEVPAPAPAAPPSAPAAQPAEVPPQGTVLRPEAPAVPEQAPNSFDLGNRDDDLDTRGRGRGRGHGNGHGNDRGHGLDVLGLGHGNGRGNGRGRHGRG